MGKKWVWIRKRCAVIKLGAVMAAILWSLCACVPVKAPREPLPEETLEAFEEALNALDVNGMMDCMDAETKKSIMAGMDIAMGLFGALTDVDLGFSAEDLIAVLPLVQGFVPVDSGDYPTVDFESTATYISGTKATVYFYEVHSGESSVVNMVKEDGMWKLSIDTHYMDESEADRIIIAGEEVTQESDDKEEADLEELIDTLAEFFGF